MEIPEILGIKHSSLDRLVELERLALRDVHRQDFRIYSGNDLAINMIEYGSDYLLGLATLRSRKIRGARPALGNGRSQVFRTVGFTAASGQCGISRASARL